MHFKIKQRIKKWTWCMTISEEFNQPENFIFFFLSNTSTLETNPSKKAARVRKKRHLTCLQTQTLHKVKYFSGLEYCALLRESRKASESIRTGGESKWSSHIRNRQCLLRFVPNSWVLGCSINSSFTCIWKIIDNFLFTASQIFDISGVFRSS